MTLGACQGEQPPKPLANAGRAGLDARTIEQLIRLPEDQIDIATAALVIAKEIDPSVDIEALRGRLDGLAHGLLKNLSGDESLQQEAEWILWFLITSEGFETVKDPFATNVRFLNNVLKDNAGNCSGLSTLFLSIAERVGWDMAAVRSPHHIFVRLRGAGDSVALEPTLGGTYKDDSFSRLFFYSEDQLDLEEYLTDLDRRACLGVMLRELVEPLSKAGRGLRSWEMAKYSTQLAPQCAEHWLVLACKEAEIGKHEEARVASLKSRELDPDNAGLWSTASVLATWAEDWEVAIAHSREAIRLSPGVGTYRFNLAVALRGAGHFSLAASAIHRARELSWGQLREVPRGIMASHWGDRSSFQRSCLALLGEIYRDASLAQDEQIEAADIAHDHDRTRELQKAAILCSQKALIAGELAASYDPESPLSVVPSLLPLADAPDSEGADWEYRSLRRELDQRLADLRAQAEPQLGTPASNQ